MTKATILHLWSFQSMEACEVLEKTGTLRTEWSRTPINWRPAYRWMASEMERGGILLDGFAPIWAWHSCEGVLYAPPTVGTARNLLSDLQILEGICVVEFEAPVEFCLLSSYGRFCELLDQILENEVIDKEEFTDMFNMLPLAAYDDIQAALPYLKMEWVMDIRYLDMKPDRWDYDWKKAV